MSVEYEPKMTVGWRVEQDEIPDYEERYDDEWEELEGLAKEASLLLDSSVWQSELCEVEDYWCGDTQIIGVPMFDHELLMGEFEERTGKLADLAEKVYEQVMRREPEDGPYLISWTQVS